MAVQNIDPIYSKVGAINAVACGGTANVSSTGTGTIGTDIFKAFTADATNGSFVQKIRLQPVSSTAANATTATTIRVFVSSVTSGATTQTNTWLIAEVAAGSQSAANSTTATFYIDIPLGFMLPPSYTILVTNHVINVANSSWTATVFGGNY